MSAGGYRDSSGCSRWATATAQTVSLAGDAVHVARSLDNDDWDAHHDSQKARPNAHALRMLPATEGALLIYGHDRDRPQRCAGQVRNASVRVFGYPSARACGHSLGASASVRVFRYPSARASGH